MRATTTRLGFLVVLLLAAACSAVGPGEDGKDFELFLEDGELDSITFEEEDNLVADEDVKLERERVGIRFAWGGEKSRGTLQLFGEDWKAGSAKSLTLFGLGGGIKGTPVISELSRDVDLILPYRADVSLAGGTDSVGTTDRTAAYLELHGDVESGSTGRDSAPVSAWP